MKLNELKKEKPTERWKKSMEEGDDLFSKKNIAESEKALDDFIDSLASLGDKPDEQKILQCVKQVVTKFNMLNEKYDYFIETMEREKLYEFIDKSVRTAGLKPESDVTEEWRDW